MPAARKKKPSLAASQAKYRVPVLVNAWKILEELSKRGPSSLNELVALTKIPKSTVFRVLSTFQTLGVVLRDEEAKRYELGKGLPGPAREELNDEAVKRRALPHMIRLRNQFGETVNLGRLEVDKVLYLEVVPSEFALRFCERPGSTSPVHATALGRALLAYSPEEVVESIVGGRTLEALTEKTITDEGRLRAELALTRRLGYSIEIEESAEQATCIAAPILDGDRRAKAAISLSGPTHRFRSKDPKVIAAVLEAARSISGG
jgi:IclR family transcriptional regulator, acetate operon repressor